ncbi:MAG: YbaK/EbsC family protein [Sulfolobales archaeon]
MVLTIPRERLEARLRELGIGYRFVVVERARTVDDAARSLGVGRDRIAKTVIVITDRGPIALFLRGSHRVDFTALRRILGLGSARMATPEEVEKITGYRVGGVPPIIEGVETIVDASLAFDSDEVFCGGGDEYTLLAIKPRELVERLGLRVYSFARPS